MGLVHFLVHLVRGAFFCVLLVQVWDVHVPVVWHLFLLGWVLVRAVSWVVWFSSASLSCGVGTSSSRTCIMFGIALNCRVIKCLILPNFLQLPCRYRLRSIEKSWINRMRHISATFGSFDNNLRVVTSIWACSGYSSVFSSIWCTLRLDVSSMLLLRRSNYLTLIKLGWCHVMTDGFLFSLVHMLGVRNYYVVEVLHGLLEKLGIFPLTSIHRTSHSYLRAFTWITSHGVVSCRKNCGSFV